MEGTAASTQVISATFQTVIDFPEARLPNPQTIQYRVVSNQSNGAQRAQVELIGYLYRLNIYLYGLNSFLIV